MGRRLEWRPLSSLQANPDNPKGHAVAGIGDSMARFGLIDIIVLDERTGWIISGHGRVESLTEQRDRGEPRPDGIRRGRGREWLVPVICGWASTDDDHADVALIALNQLSIGPGFNEETLLERLDQLAATPAGLDGIGIDQTDRDDMLARVQERQARLQAEDQWGFGDQARQVRSIMLDLKLDDYRWATGVMVRARDHHQLDSNADLFLALLDDDETRTQP